MKAVLAGALACLLAFSGTLAAVEYGAFDAKEAPVVALADEGTPRVERLSQRETAARIAERPEWRVGDAWLVRFNGDFACWLVVGEVRNGTYVQGTSCDGDREAGAQIAANDYPYAGAFDRDLGRATRKDGAIRLYDWPLTDGKTWTTSWFGEEVTVRASFEEEVEGPFGEEPGFALTMSYGDAESPFLRYDYVPSLRWWSEFRYESGAAILVEDAERGWDGRVVMIEGEEMVQYAQSALALGPLQTFRVDEDHDAIIVEVRASGALRVDVTLRDADQQERYRDTRQSTVPVSGYRFGLIDELSPGTWMIDEYYVGMGDVRVSVHALRIDVRSL